jgi:glycosyltransferase involved in cell wall biosynthesis
MQPETIRFLNTFEPVTTMYRDLLPFFAGHGCRVEVLLSRAQYRAGREPTWIVPGVQVHWMPHFGLQPRARLGKFLLMLAYMVFGALHTLLGPRVDKNVFLTQPPLFVLWGYLLRKLRGEAYYQVLMDIYPDLAIEAGMLKGDSAGARILKRLSRFALRNADGIIVIGRCMEGRVVEMGVDPARITFIPNWTDEGAIVPIAPGENPFRQEQGWQGKLVVLYSGNVGTSHYFDDILEVSRRMRERANVVFAFIGSGQRLGEIEAYKHEHALENIVLLPFQRQEVLAYSLSAGDVHFVSLRSGFEGLVVPSKAYGVLAAGRPILYQGPSCSEIARLVAENDIGCVVPQGDSDALYQVLHTYTRNPVLRQRLGEGARRLAEGPFSRHVACERYATALGIGPVATG